MRIDEAKFGYNGPFVEVVFFGKGKKPEKLYLIPKTSIDKKKKVR